MNPPDRYEVPWTVAQERFPEAFVAFDLQCTDISEQQLERMTFRLYRKSGTMKSGDGRVTRDRLSMIAHGYQLPNGKLVDLKLVWHPIAQVWSRGSHAFRSTPHGTAEQFPVNGGLTHYVGPFSGSIHDLVANGSCVRIDLIGDTELTGIAVKPPVLTDSNGTADVRGRVSSGRHLTIVNASMKHTLTLLNESAYSWASHRFLVGSALNYWALGPGSLCSVAYDHTSARWNVQGFLM